MESCKVFFCNLLGVSVSWRDPQAWYLLLSACCFLHWLFSVPLVSGSLEWRWKAAAVVIPMNGRESLYWVPLDNVASSRFLRNTCLKICFIQNSLQSFISTVKTERISLFLMVSKGPQSSSSREWLLFTLHSDHPDKHCFCWQLSSLSNPPFFFQVLPRFSMSLHS